MKNGVRLIYASTIAETMTQDMLSNIMQTSVANNSLDGITGLLAYNDRFFWQLLDGPQKQVNQLYQRLIADDRHADVRLIYYNQLSSAAFCSWSMQLLEIPAFVKNELIHTYGKFDLYEISAHHALEIMEMLRDRAASEC